MSDPLSVPATERGVVRVFQVTIEAGTAGAFQAPGAIDRALGLRDVNTDYVEVFPVSDLAGVGLATYLVDGCGVPEPVIAPDRDRLDLLTGHLMVVLSKAFRAQPAQIAPAAQLHLVGIYAETPVDWTGNGPIETASARPGSGPGQTPPDPGATRRIGTTLLLAMLAIIAIFALFLLF